MIRNQTEYQEKLKKFVDAYLSYGEKLEMEGISDEELTRALNDYFNAANELTDFVQEVYDEEEAELPRMDVFFTEKGYHDFAYRMYLAVCNSNQLPEIAEWRIFTRAYIGELLHNRYVNN